MRAFGKFTDCCVVHHVSMSSLHGCLQIDMPYSKLLSSPCRCNECREVSLLCRACARVWGIQDHHQERNSHDSHSSQPASISCREGIVDYLGSDVAGSIACQQVAWILQKVGQASRTLSQAASYSNTS